MKGTLEAWLQRRWYGGKSPGIGLRALAALYGRAARGRTSEPSVRVPVPVVVIGNFTAGGTGKTPLAIAIARILANRGYRPGVVSRGHGRRSRRPVRVDDRTPIEDSGDEPRLVFDRTGLPVFVDSDRVAAAERAVAAGCNVVIADDGLQHRRLHRDIEIEVVDGERGYGNGLLLPAGPLREQPRPCDFRVVNGPGPSRPGDWRMILALGDARSLQDASRRRPLPEFAGEEVDAIAAIGNPDRFFSALERAGLTVHRKAYADHHEFRRSDFDSAGRTILMTEKDAVKCRALGLDNAWAVPVDAELPAEFFEALLSRLPAP